MARSGLGELRHRVRLERRKRVPSGDSGFDEVFEPIATVWASLNQMGGTAWMDDAAAGEHGGPGATHAFTVRYRPGFAELPDVRTYLFWDGRRFKVAKARRIDNRGDWMTLFCEPQETSQDASDDD